MDFELSRRDLVFREGTKGAVLKLDLKKHGYCNSLEGNDVFIKVKRIDELDYLVEWQCIQLVPAEGLCSYTLEDDDLPTHGLYELELVVRSDDVEITIPHRLTMEVRLTSEVMA